MAPHTPHQPQALDCPACGAALPAGQGRVECSYCGTIVQIDPPRPSEARPQSGQPSSGVSWSTPTVTIISSGTRPAQRKKSTNFVWVLVLCCVLLVAGSGLYAFQLVTGTTLFNPATLFQPKLNASQTLAILTPDRPRPQIVMRVSGGEENANRLAVLDLATNQRIWVGSALSKNSYSGEIAVTDTLVVFSDDRTLIGFSRADGTRRWVAQLSDKVCTGCLVVTNDTAVALTADLIVQGVDLQTGERTWSYDKLGGYAQRRLQVIGSTVLVYGRDPDVHGQVQLLDGKTGKLVSEFVPHCDVAGEAGQMVYTDPDNAQWLSADGRMLVVTSDSSPPCIHAYDTATGRQLWQATLEPPESGLMLHKEFVLSAGELFLGGSSRIYAVGLEDGAARIVATSADHAFLPLAIRDGVVFTIAIKQRGTRLIELWGVDAKNGEIRWRHPFQGNGEMFEPPYDAAGTISGDEQIWGWGMTTAGFTLVTLSAEPQHYTIATLDAKTGQALDTRTIERAGDNVVLAPDQAARQGNLLYLVSRARLLVLDLANGTVAYEGP